MNITNDGSVCPGSLRILLSLSFLHDQVENSPWVAVQAHMYSLNELGFVQKRSLPDTIAVTTGHDQFLGSEIRFSTIQTHPYEIELRRFQTIMAYKYLISWQCLKMEGSVLMFAYITL